MNSELDITVQGVVKWGIIELDREVDENTILDSVVAFDPGGTTGVAIWLLNRVLWLEVSDILTIWNIMNRQVPKERGTIVFEKFVPEVGTPWETSALEIQGLVKLWQAQGGHVVWQYRHQIKTSIPDDLLKHHALWVSGAQHARDAIKHLLRYFIDHGDTSWLDHLKPNIEE